MIKVRCGKDKLEMNVEGHACSGEQGHDLVCAAASALVDTLCANLMVMDRCGAFDNIDITRDRGFVQVRCVPKDEHKASAVFIYDIFCVGFDLLMRNFPKNILFELVEEEG